MILRWAVPTLVGCVAMEPSGQPFKPVPAAVDPVEVTDAPEAVLSEPATAEPTRETEASPDSFDFEAADRDSEPEGSAAASVASAILPAEPEPEPAAPRADAPIWDPSKPLSDASFGVRVVATLLELTPPRAVLGLPNGDELVVRPGTMLEPHGLVVLAIGRDAVQIAKITPQGFHASVTTETIRALYPDRSQE